MRDPVALAIVVSTARLLGRAVSWRMAGAWARARPGPPAARGARGRRAGAVSPPFSLRPPPRLRPLPPPPISGLLDQIVAIRRGDTLTSLARCYHTTVPAIQQLNHLGHS